MQTQESSSEPPEKSFQEEAFSIILPSNALALPQIGFSKQDS